MTSITPTFSVLYMLLLSTMTNEKMLLKELQLDVSPVCVLKLRLSTRVQTVQNDQIKTVAGFSNASNRHGLHNLQCYCCDAVFRSVILTSAPSILTRNFT